MKQEEYWPVRDPGYRERLNNIQWTRSLSIQEGVYFLFSRRCSRRLFHRSAFHPEAHSLCRVEGLPPDYAVEKPWPSSHTHPVGALTRVFPPMCAVPAVSLAPTMLSGVSITHFRSHRRAKHDIYHTRLWKEYICYPSTTVRLSNRVNHAISY